MPYNATVRATGEKLTVYKLIQAGTFYDYDNMGGDKPPAAMKAGKKEFRPDELIIHDEVKEK